jgi:hypothetical protein
MLGIIMFLACVQRVLKQCSKCVGYHNALGMYSNSGQPVFRALSATIFVRNEMPADTDDCSDVA